MLICCVVGARPNFMKMAPVVQELRRRGIPQLLVHTGQHYEEKMSRVFFDELGLPKPDADLGVGSDSHARQTARIMIAFEEFCGARRPSLILVGGDVNSTAAASLVGAKERIPLGHVEAGLRSFDRSMPEEINRVVTDHLSQFLFTTEESANHNLLCEGVPQERIHFVGNCMVDTLLTHLDAAIAREPWAAFDLAHRQYGILTLHRPSNVDSVGSLEHVMRSLREVARHLPILFPVHPRTRARLDGWQAKGSDLRLCEPLGYVTFLGLMAGARFVLTDSGGIQEETTALGIPCLTLRTNTERPSTLTHGTNCLVGTDSFLIRSSIDQILSGNWPCGRIPPLWDGKASARIADAIQASDMA